MTEPEKGPRGQRRGRGARERILDAAQQLFREQGINTTGMQQLCEVASVSKHTAYQHFESKDELIAEYLRRQDPDTMPEVFDRGDLTPRQRLLAAFDQPAGAPAGPTPLCPFIDAAVEIADPRHPARVRARDYKRSVASRFAEAARQAGAGDPELLGEQLALLLDGASARTRALGADAGPTAAGIAAALIERALGAQAPARPRPRKDPVPARQQGRRRADPGARGTRPSPGPA